jgi:lipoprotein-anchoring transpeptidase ErfK/SrfK
VRRFALAFLAAVLAAAAPALAAKAPGEQPLPLAAPGGHVAIAPVPNPPDEPLLQGPPVRLPPPRAAAPPPRPKPKPEPKPAVPARIAPGVTIGGVAVGGLSPYGAWVAVRAAFAQPLPLLVAGSLVRVAPASAGAVAYAKLAVAEARRAAGGTAVPLETEVRAGPLRALVAALGRRFDRAPVDSQLSFRDGKPFLSAGAPGRQLDQEAAVTAIRAALAVGTRDPVALDFTAVPQKVNRFDFGPVIVIERGSNSLELYDGMRLERTFGVATGQTVYPTPLGRFSIAVKWRNPWWYPPASPWAKGLHPIPPGPGNPLGTRWMGITAPGVGIHGTPDDASIGYSLSHGCIRMHIPDAEWLFEHVNIGTPVFIVPA